MIDKSRDCIDLGDCSKAEKLIDSYIDGVLQDAEEVFIKRHLDDCPGCQRGYRFEEAFHLRLKALKPVCMPEQVKSQIMLALGFPGMSNSQSIQMPKGDIPQGEIPKSNFFRRSEDTSGTEDSN